MAISLKDIQKTGRGLPSRVVLYGPPGIGKTSIGCRLPGALIVQTEDGTDDLIDSGNSPEVAHTPLIADWPALIAFLGSLDATAHPYKTIVLDSLTAAERLCHEHVCSTNFGSRWTAPQGADSFTAYGKGYHVAASQHWPDLFRVLDLLRVKHRMAVLALAHATVRKRRRPDTEDFEQYVPSLHESTLDPTVQWADSVLFFNFKSITTKQDGRTKGVGGAKRVLYCENRDTHLAKNRVGLPVSIPLGESADEAAAVFLQAFRDAKSKTRNTPQPEPKETETTQ